jgi:putative ABC transport system substrate-binding protein
MRPPVVLEQSAPVSTFRGIRSGHLALLNLGPTSAADINAVRRLQQLLQRNSVRVSVTGLFDQQTVDAVKFFQREHVGYDGYYLTESGTVDEATLEALANARHRFRIALFNYLLILITLCVIYRWNSHFWLPENSTNKNLLDLALIGVTGIIFGIQPLSLFVAAAGTRYLRAIWYRTQSSVIFSSLLAAMLAGCAAVLMVYPRQVAAAGLAKELVHIGIVLNGDAPHVHGMKDGFIQRLESLFARTEYAANLEIVTGDPNQFENNAPVFEELIRRFPNAKPDLLVTIGTQVTEFAYNRYRSRFPVVFMGVTDPVASGLVKSYDRGRQEAIAGSSYGPPTVNRLATIAKIVGKNRLGFVYDPELTQDQSVMKQVRELALGVWPRLNVKMIPTRKKELTAEEVSDVDVLFGWYHLHINLATIARSVEGKPIISRWSRHAMQTAVAAIGADDRDIGASVAEKIIAPHILDGVPLQQTRILRPNSMVTVLNLDIAERSKLILPSDAPSHATLVIKHRQ